MNNKEYTPEDIQDMENKLNELFNTKFVYILALKAVNEFYGDTPLGVREYPIVFNVLYAEMIIKAVIKTAPTDSLREIIRSHVLTSLMPAHTDLGVS